jgi:hypothetical protein
MARKATIVGWTTKVAGTFYRIAEEAGFTRWQCHLCGRVYVVAPPFVEPDYPCPCQEGAPPLEVCHEYEGAVMRILNVGMREHTSEWMRLLGHFPAAVDGDMAMEAKMMRARADALERLYDERKIPMPRLP